MVDLKKKDTVYYARIMPSVGIYDLLDINIRTVAETYFVGVDKRDKRAYLFNNDALGKTVFTDRKEALKVVKEAEKHKTKIISNEIYYEEY